ncbi:MAG: ribosome small subunit-dependent GTPase A [Fimbriimonadaceae bacterium]|nr:ribosome small subunit-dependent GTPase A [Chitinophagales bacterium]
MQGIVIQSTGSFYDVMLDGGEIIVCRLKGKFRLDDKKQTNPVAVGDKVIIEKDVRPGGEVEHNRDNFVIEEIHPRKNYIIRSDTHKKEFKNIIASNIDQCVIIASLIQPRTSYGFIDRVLLTAEVYDIPAYVIFNKHDLYRKRENELLEEFMFSYNEAGYKSFSTSVIKNENLDKLKALLQNKTTLLTGHSGVGKSTLVNTIEPQLNLKVKEISKHTEKGKHTTTFARMYKLSFGGFIIDTPGIKEFGLMDIEAYEVGHYFPEIRKLIDKCKFNNCLHINEEGCVVKQLLEEGKFSPSRYNSYVTIHEEIKAGRKW